MEDGRWRMEDELLTLLCGDGLAGANGGNVKLSFLAHAAFCNLLILHCCTSHSWRRIILPLREGEKPNHPFQSYRPVSIRQRLIAGIVGNI